VTININGLSEAKWKYILNLPVMKSVSVIISTEHHLSATSARKKCLTADGIYGLWQESQNEEANSINIRVVLQFCTETMTT